MYKYPNILNILKYILIYILSKYIELNVDIGMERKDLRKIEEKNLKLSKFYIFSAN